MSHSASLFHSDVITFRCSADFKTQMGTTARDLNISRSDLIRLALEQFMQSSKLREAKSPAAEREATVTTTMHMDNTPMRDAVIHHHISFLNREEYNYHGFRFSIRRQKHPLQRYFSPNDYGSAGAALAAVIAVRDYVLEQLALRPFDQEKIFEESWHIAPRPCRQTDKQ